MSSLTLFISIIFTTPIQQFVILFFIVSYKTPFFNSYLRQKSESTPILGGLRRHSRGQSKSTRIVSSPITLISFQHILISSCRPNSPRHFGLPHIIIEIRQPEQVSISTSQTEPKRYPSLKFITSLAFKSVIQQFIITPHNIICAAFALYG